MLLGKHSYATEPKERWVIYNRLSGLNGTNQHKIISENPDLSDLKEEDCKEIGYIDVEKLANDFDPDKNSEARKGFIEGFKKDKPLNDKQFSLEDIREAIKLTKLSENYPHSHKKYDDEIIQSLQKTEWDVEVNELNQITKVL